MPAADTHIWLRLPLGAVWIVTNEVYQELPIILLRACNRRTLKTAAALGLSIGMGRTYVS